MMVLNVSPGDTVRVSFTLTNTGSPVGGIGADQHEMVPSFANEAVTWAITGDPIVSIWSGAMATNESKPFSLDIPIPLNTPPDSYNLWMEAFAPDGTKIIDEIIQPSSINVAGVYSAAISNIMVTKVV